MQDFSKKNSESKKIKFPSELRFDLVSKDWVVIATGRGRRPESFSQERRRAEKISEKKCPFCNIKAQETPILEYKNKKGEWSVVVIPNKFPAFSKGEFLKQRQVGPYRVMDGVGHCEIVITRDHYRQFAQLSVGEMRQVLDAYHERYLDLMNEKFINYVSIFHNHGREAGASIAHPHSQIIAHPLIDPDLKNSLAGSKNFWKKHKKRCVHCAMLDWDKKDGQRIIFENKKFLVLVPFTSRMAFETRIYPKEHLAYFERIEIDEKDYLAEAFQTVLYKLYKGLNNPPYNFFLHTAPCDGRNYDHYHWHWEILPKTSVWAGFELGTGIEISTIEPEKAAEYLKHI
ncbi:MAG: galactose-1-phosphate uridylyltransferase [Parcubacteria group bacterium CG11_big_fil_rev_8_21_14_0_20_39_14]|nr:MAG: galactose-1-phosphate uridylyltransferase [Parcubacteria group bacterium CG11_big_fil_rev_8_21_14_0_20_39_14]PIS35283.1 MAG: galactose-1-phosphate uridylyltransferase [Parcubacteria group bacterium CG08_land_8_20_14_0_20_38_56]